jgi:hypothetical protein
VQDLDGAICLAGGQERGETSRVTCSGAAARNGTAARAAGCRKCPDPTVDVAAAYCQQRFCLFSLPEFAEILLTLPAPARRKLLGKIRQLKQDLHRLLENARAP